MGDLPRLDDARVLVAGDVMLDRYWSGDSQRISPEAPVPVVHVRDDQVRAGGASNVALNIRALGGVPLLLGLTGADDNARKLRELLAEHRVEYHFDACSDLDTCVKLRIIARHQQMIRLDFEDDFVAVDKLWLLRTFKNLLDRIDAVVLSDYGKGTLSDVQTLIALAARHGRPVAVDPIGKDYSRYAGATVVTPNRAEFEAVVGCCATDHDLMERGERLRRELRLGALLVTRGEEGMTLMEQGREPWHLSTCAREVFDVTGAGDTVLAAVGVALAAGVELRDAVALANLAAGIVVGKLGTATATMEEIHDQMYEQQKQGCGIVDEDELERVVRLARQRGERVIMTNGCFDILHAGHVHYLQQARALGNWLVVAVNSDESVRRLKGDDRPVNGLQERVTLLAALSCVDWVVPFSEDTPERLYCKVKPDVVVKGGDYSADQVAGADCVRAGGGVVILGYLPGKSTSGIISRIRG